MLTADALLVGIGREWPSQMLVDGDAVHVKCCLEKVREDLGPVGYPVQDHDENDADCDGNCPPRQEGEAKEELAPGEQLQLTFHALCFIANSADPPTADAIEGGRQHHDLG